MRKLLLLILFLISQQSFAVNWYAIPETGIRPDGVSCSSNGDGTLKTCAVSNGAAGAWIGTNNILAASTSAGDTVYMCNTSATAGFSRATSWVNNDVGVAGSYVTYEGDCSAQYTNGQTFATLTNTGGSFNLNATTGQYRKWNNIKWLGGGAGDCVKYTGTAGLDQFINNTASGCTGGGWNLQGTVGNNFITSPNFNTETKPTCDGRAGAGMTACVATSSPANIIRNVTSIYTGTTGVSNNTDAFAIDDGSGGSLLEDITCAYNKSGDGACIDVQDSTIGDIAIPINVYNFYVHDTEGPGITSTDYSFVTFSGGLIENAGTYGCFPKGNLSNRQRYINLTIRYSGSYGCKIGASAIGVPSGVTIANNIFYKNNGVNIALDVDTTSAVIDYNIYFDGPGFASNITGTTCDGLYPSLCTFAQWREQSGIDVHSTDGTDPKLFSGIAKAKNYLKSDSPAKRAGFDFNLGNYLDGAGRSFAHPPSIGGMESASGDEITSRTTATSRTVQ